MKKILEKILLLLFFLILTSCATTKTPTTIFKPNTMYRSPSLNFTKIYSIAIMPVNNEQDEIPEISSAINDGFPAELKSAQNAWKIFSSFEILKILNEKGWGRGYQNYIADLNTYDKVGGYTPNFTAETQSFFQDLANELGFQAIVFSSYSYNENIIPGEKLLYGFVDLSIKKKELSITTILYDINSKRAWWIAKISVEGEGSVTSQELVKAAIQGIVQNFGKGSLRQL